MEECPTADMLLVVLAQALLDVGEPGSDAVLVSFECGQGFSNSLRRSTQSVLREHATSEDAECSRLASLPPVTS